MQNAAHGKGTERLGLRVEAKGRALWREADPYHDPETGRTKRKTESMTKPDWGAAHRWLLGKRTDLLGGIVVSVEDPPLGDFLAGWLRDVVEPADAPEPT